ncbi:hypothetical protein O181_115492 [Austropuccinia psidii MF-1]|uniref:Uncharacterized protein n=1 Tax=Austropuccinia psidii MF-1 TaxID=1389203 RepID=A0A9Q3K9M3_9BASI|nr:hypothetical protein [Austropuccinia psidii MF-1]
MNPHLRGFEGGHKLVMAPISLSSKLTELTEYSPSAPPPSTLCGSGVFSRLSSPSMASSDHFDASQIYDGYRAVEILDPACTEFLSRVRIVFNTTIPDLQGAIIASLERNYVIVPGYHLLTSGVTSSRQGEVARWTNVGGPIPGCGRPIYSSSEVPISRINTEGVVKRIRRIADSPTDPDAEGSDELDASCQVIPSTPRTFQPVLSSIPTTITPSSASTSHARPALNPEVRPSPSQKPGNSPHNHLSIAPTCGQFQ